LRCEPALQYAAACPASEWQERITNLKNAELSAAILPSTGLMHGFLLIGGDDYVFHRRRERRSGPGPAAASGSREVMEAVTPA
jgi:hypothetical protein